MLISAPPVLAPCPCVENPEALAMLTSPLKVQLGDILHWLYWYSLVDASFRSSSSARAPPAQSTPGPQAQAGYGSCHSPGSLHWSTAGPPVPCLLQLQLSHQGSPGVEYPETPNLCLLKFQLVSHSHQAYTATNGAFLHKITPSRVGEVAVLPDT